MNHLKHTMNYYSSQESSCIGICTKNIKNPFTGFEDIYQQIFPAKFRKNPTLPVGIDSILESAGSLSLKINSPWQGQILTKLCKEDLLVDILKSIGARFSISSVQVKIWQVFLIYKANWNCRSKRSIVKAG